VSLDEFEYYVIHAHPAHPSQSGGPVQPPNYQLVLDIQEARYNEHEVMRGHVLAVVAESEEDEAIALIKGATMEKLRDDGLGEASGGSADDLMIP
jgi:hypothetical protein